MYITRPMALQHYLDGTNNSTHAISLLTAEPYFLEVRDNGDLYCLMFSDKTPSSDVFPFLEEVVGTVIDKSSNKICGYGFKRTTEVILTEQDAMTQIQKTLSDEKLSECTVVPYVEGVKITVYFASNRWMMSTNKSIDARSAFWRSNKSFGDQFLSALRAVRPTVAEQIDTGAIDGPLKRGLSYAFILVKPEHLQSSHLDTVRLLHSSTVTLPHLSVIQADIGVERPRLIPNKNFAELVRSLNFESHKQPGVIVQGKRRFKFLTESYIQFKKVGGDHPNVKYQWLCIRQSDDAKRQFLQSYPQFTHASLGVEASLHIISRRLYDMYLRYWIYKAPRPHISKPIFVILKGIHVDHMRTKVKTTFSAVHEHVVSQEPDTLLRLIDVPDRFYLV